MAHVQLNNIAVVDDDAAVLDSYQFLLELAGYAVKTYASALDYLASNDPAPCCMILDQNMPSMTGLELAARLREKEILLPIMLVTSSLTAAIIARAVNLGIERIMEKPPSEKELLGFVSSNQSN